MNTQFDIIFDNGGGCTIQHPTYIHHYDNMGHAAHEVALLLGEVDPGDWEGHEPEHKIEYDHQSVANGGYRWFDSSELADFSDYDYSGDLNVMEFFDELKRRA